MIKILKWILVFTCMIQIFLLSADPAYKSEQKSNSIIVWISERIVGHTLNEKEKEEKINQFVLLVRKGAHFCIYGLLGFLIISLIKEYRKLEKKELYIAFILSVIYACSDEIHQLFVPGRSGSIIDIGIDSLGALGGVLIYYGFYQIRRKHEQESIISHPCCCHFWPSRWRLPQLPLL